MNTTKYCFNTTLALKMPNVLKRVFYKKVLLTYYIRQNMKLPSIHRMYKI